MKYETAKCEVNEMKSNNDNQKHGRYKISEQNEITKLTTEKTEG